MNYEKSAGELMSIAMEAKKKSPGQAVPPKGETAEKLIARKKRQLQRKARPQDKGIATKKKREAVKAAKKTTYKQGKIKPNQA